MAAFADFHTTLTSLGDWSFSEAKRERLPRGISTLPDVSLADQLSMLTVLVEAEIECLEVLVLKVPPDAQSLQHSFD